jgi:hypothetical protein
MDLVAAQALVAEAVAQDTNAVQSLIFIQVLAVQVKLFSDI